LVRAELIPGLVGGEVVAGSGHLITIADPKRSMLRCSASSQAQISPDDPLVSGR
jgi:hypothetical protein